MVPASSVVSVMWASSGGMLVGDTTATHAVVPGCASVALTNRFAADSARCDTCVSQDEVLPPPAPMLSVAAKRDDSWAPCVTLSQVWKAKPALIVPKRQHHEER